MVRSVQRSVPQPQRKKALAFTTKWTEGNKSDRERQIHLTHTWKPQPKPQTRGAEDTRVAAERGAWNWGKGLKGPEVITCAWRLLSITLYIWKLLRELVFKSTRERREVFVTV